MDKFFIGRAIGFLVLLLGLGTVAAFYTLNDYIYKEKQGPDAVYTPSEIRDHRNATYSIEGKSIKLGTEGTQYFGNELRRDLDGDGREDIVFIITQNTGGSGTFYYVVAALDKADGYRGSDAVLLGDRIAPQTTEKGKGKIIVVNYADRKPGEPFSTAPSVGKTIWLLLDVQSMQFGEVAQNFEGEAEPARMRLDMKKWDWVETTYNDGTKIVPRLPKFTLTFKGNTFSASTDCNGVGGEYIVQGSSIKFERMMSTLMYCEGSQEQIFSQMMADVENYRFTSKGELVFGLKSKGGVMVWR